MTDSPPAAPAKRLHHRLHGVVRGLMIALVAMLALVGALGLRLAFGPLSVGFLEPILRDRMVVGAGSRLDFDDATLALRRPSLTDKGYVPGLEIRLSDMRLRGADSGAGLSLPEGALTLSLPALLRGELAARSLDLRGLRLSLTWRDGDLFTALSDGGEAGPLASLIPALLMPRGASTDSELRRVRLGDAAVLISEAASASVWRLNDFSLELMRDANTLTLLGEAMLIAPGMSETPLQLSGSYDPTAGETAVELAFEALNPALLAGQSQVLARLQGVDVLASGSVALTLDRQGEVRWVGGTLASAAGQVTLPSAAGAPMRFQVDGLQLEAYYHVAEARLDIHALEVRAARGIIRGDGVVSLAATHRGVTFTGTVQNLHFADLGEYWPEGLAQGARTWIVRNITNGVVTDGTLVLNIPALDGEAALPASAVDFQFNFNGMTTNYLRPMPPISGGAGYARLTAHDLTVDVKSGAAAGVKVAGSKVHLRDIHIKRGAVAEIAAKLSGDVPAVLRLIDSPPLGYPSKYGIKPESIGGGSRVDLKLKLPLLKSVTLADVTFDVTADLSDVRIAQLFDGVGLNADALRLKVNDEALTGAGVIELNGVPFNLEWREDFKTEGQLPTRYVLTGAVAGKGWDVLSLPFASWVDGPANVRLELEGRGPAIMRGRGDFDFWSARMEAPDLGWRKEAHKPALARFQFERGDDRIMTVRNMVYEDDGLRLSGTVKVDDGPGVRDMIIDSLKIGQTHLAGVVSRQGTAGYDISVTAESFDARPFLSRLFSGDGKKTDLPDLNLDILASRVVGLRDVSLHDVAVSARFAGGQWGASKGSGRFKDGGVFDFELVEPTEVVAQSLARRRFAIRSDNAAEVVRALGLFNDAVGGTLDFTGSMTPPGPDQRIDGVIKIDGFRVVRANVLAKLLSVGSLTGIGDLLRGEGIRFERFSAPFQLADGIMAFKEARAWGPAIGLTADGKVSLNTNEAALAGAVVPAYTANSVLGRLPIIGNLIVGGEGGGIFAFSYSITGKLDDPNVSVNPLSVLTPGFLRNIFEGAPKLEEEQKR